MVAASSGRSVRMWLLLCSFLIFSTVAIGGLTRLTRSGLSIVEWKPISGVIPPLNDEQWQAEFQKYQQYPEYNKVNAGMELSEFKRIFYWEYLHRLLGRLIGVVFGIPLIVYVWKRQIRGRLALKLGLALLLGGAQGALGWFMVKSGLVELPRVSHYRLAAHLSLALFLMCFLFWIAMDLSRRLPTGRHLGALRRLAKFFLALVVFQIFFGALTAGLRAGHMYNTFPSMNGLWVPQGIGSMGAVRDFFENPVTVQFVHRTLGWLTLASSLVVGYLAFKNSQISQRVRFSLLLLPLVCLLQFTLGVLTLLHSVPVTLGSLHQMGACLVLILSVRSVHILSQHTSYVRG